MNSHSVEHPTCVPWPAAVLLSPPWVADRSKIHRRRWSHQHRSTADALATPSAPSVSTATTPALQRAHRGRPTSQRQPNLEEATARSQQANLNLLQRYPSPPHRARPGHRRGPATPSSDSASAISIMAGYQPRRTNWSTLGKLGRDAGGEGEVLDGGSVLGSASRSCCGAASRWWVNDTSMLSPTPPPEVRELGSRRKNRVSTNRFFNLPVAVPVI
jgi:hypothetical protein